MAAYPLSLLSAVAYASSSLQTPVTLMPLAPPLTLTLTQTKRFSGPPPRTERFVVQSRVVPSAETVNMLEAAFIIGPAAGVDRERLLRVVNLNNPVDAALVAPSPPPPPPPPTTNNPLTFFRDQVLDLAGGLAAPNDVLRVSLPPGEWSTDGTTPLTMDFLIADVDVPNQRIEMVAPFWWSAQNLTYTILTPDLLTPRTGPNIFGMTERTNTAVTAWRSDRITMGFATAIEALDHMASVQAFMASLGLQIKLDVQEYLTTGGNPVVNTY